MPPGDYSKGAYRTWYSNIQLSVGEYVLPTVLNGHYYKVTASDGQAGAAQPVWPLTSGGTVTTDGVTYAEQGTYSWVEAYDSNYAIAQAWLLKTTKLADRYLFMSGGKMFSRNQFYDHCMDLYRRFLMKSPLRAVRLAPSFEDTLIPIQRVN